MNIGTAECINCLLGIADHEKSITTATLDENAPEDLPLEVVGVLELVDQAEAKALTEDRSERGATWSFERVPDPCEHVVVVDLSMLMFVAIEPFFKRRQVEIG